MNQHKLYFIRHALTEANISGDLVKNYDEYDIIRPLNKELWYKRVGCHIDNYEDVSQVLCSPTLRCISTSKELFPNAEIKVDNRLKELDCSDLGNLKFWEVTREEFDSKVHVDLAAFQERQTNLLKSLSNLCFFNNQDQILVTHGLFIRCLYYIISGKGDNNLYDLINSRSFKFKNLDMLECTIINGKISVTGVYQFI